MQGYALRPFEGLSYEERVRSISNRASRVAAAQEEASARVHKLETDLASLAEEELILQKVGELFRVLTDRMVHDHVQSISTAVTDGLRAIFGDQELTFVAEVGQKYNKVSLDFSLRSGELDRGGYQGPPLEAFGGGPSSVVSLVLRVLTLLRLRRAPLLLLDETLAAVSDEYVEATGIFLRRLAESAGLDVLLVTHKTAFLEHAKVSYQGDTEPGGNAFVVRRTRASS